MSNVLLLPPQVVDDARHRLQPPFEDPVLDGLEVGHRVAGRTDHAVAEYLADRAGRRDERLRAVGQRTGWDRRLITICAACG